MSDSDRFAWVFGLMFYWFGMFFAGAKAGRWGVALYLLATAAVLAFVYRKPLARLTAIAWRPLRPVATFLSRTIQRWGLRSVLVGIAWILATALTVFALYVASFEGRMNNTLKLDSHPYRVFPIAKQLEEVMQIQGIKDARVLVLNDHGYRHVVVVHPEVNARHVAEACMLRIPEHAIYNEGVDSLSWARSLGWWDWIHRTVITRDDFEPENQGTGRGRQG